jgi:hypothetical protein
VSDESPFADALSGLRKGWRLHYPPVPPGFVVIGFAVKLVRLPVGRSPFEGRYVRSWSPDDPAGLGLGSIDTVDGPGFFYWPTVADVLASWQRQSTQRPLRHDGFPNRPLTIWTIEIEPVAGRRV